MAIDYQRFSASDGALFEAIQACVEQKKPFEIVADRSFRHRKPLMRMLRSAAGEKERRGFLRSVFDAYVTADVMACLGLAANDNGYLWDFDVSSDAVVIAFDPPGVANADPSPSESSP